MFKKIGRLGFSSQETNKNNYYGFEKFIPSNIPSAGDMFNAIPSH